MCSHTGAESSEKFMESAMGAACLPAGQPFLPGSSGMAHNQQNAVIRSKYRGLSWDKKHQGWRVRIYFAGKQRHVGRFEDDVTAAKAYDKAAVYLYGANAITNFGLESCQNDPTEVSAFIVLAKEQADQEQAARSHHRQHSYLVLQPGMHQVGAAGPGGYAQAPGGLANGYAAMQHQQAALLAHQQQQPGVGHVLLQHQQHQQLHPGGAGMLAQVPAGMDARACWPAAAAGHPALCSVPGASGGSGSGAYGFAAAGPGPGSSSSSFASMPMGLVLQPQQQQQQAVVAATAQPQQQQHQVWVAGTGGVQPMLLHQQQQPQQQAGLATHAQVLPAGQQYVLVAAQDGGSGGQQQQQQPLLATSGAAAAAVAPGGVLMCAAPGMQHVMLASSPGGAAGMALAPACAPAGAADAAGLAMLHGHHHHQQQPQQQQLMLAAAAGGLPSGPVAPTSQAAAAVLVASSLPQSAPQLQLPVGGGPGPAGPSLQQDSGGSLLAPPCSSGAQLPTSSLALGHLPGMHGEAPASAALAGTHGGSGGGGVGGGSFVQDMLQGLSYAGGSQQHAGALAGAQHEQAHAAGQQHGFGGTGWCSAQAAAVGAADASSGVALGCAAVLGNRHPMSGSLLVASGAAMESSPTFSSGSTASSGGAPPLALMLPSAAGWTACA